MGLVAGVLERAGIATVVLSCLAEITEQVRPPRWIDLPYPLGFPVGPPGRVAEQRRTLLVALNMLTEVGPPSPRGSP